MRSISVTSLLRAAFSGGETQLAVLISKLMLTLSCNGSYRRSYSSPIPPGVPARRFPGCALAKRPQPARPGSLSLCRLSARKVQFPRLAFVCLELDCHAESYSGSVCECLIDIRTII